MAATQTTQAPSVVRWSGCIGVEGELTGDGRSFAVGALRWPDPDELAAEPLPYRYVSEDIGGHDNAVSVGTIDEIVRTDDGSGMILGAGTIDLEAPYGFEAFQAAASKRQNGVSMDLDDVTAELRVAAELLEDPEIAPEPTLNDDGSITVATISPDMEVQHTLSARIRAVTQVAIPAFFNAKINVDEADAGLSEDEDENPDVIVSTNATDLADLPVEDVSKDPARNARAQRDAASLTASAPPMLPPKAWFADPKLQGPTALTITKEGRIYGHLATWGSCHLSHMASGRCVTPYASASGYAWFHTGAIETAEGDILAIGRITLGTGHAVDGLSPMDTLAHYDNTGTAVADVRMYEDSHGIAYAGALRPGLTPLKLRQLRASPLSADWRRVGANMELVAALAVNVPGYGIPRTRMHADTLGLTSLVAAGILLPIADTKRDDGIQIDTLSPEDVKFLRAQVNTMRKQQAAELASRVRTSLVASAAPVNKKKVEAFAKRRATTAPTKKD